MKFPLTATLLLAFAIASPTALAGGDKAKGTNPLFKASKLQYQYPPFDKIQDQHFAPAFEKGMAEHRKEIDAIANSKKAPTFENTVVAMEKTGQMLTRTINVFFNLSGVMSNDAKNQVQTEMAPKLSAHQDYVTLNDKLFKRVSAIHAKRDALDAESKRLVERYYTDFIRAGANLSASQKEALKKLNAELATLQTQFVQNTLKEVNASALVLDDKAQLAGLSEDAIAAAAEAAKARKLEGKYLLALLNTSQQPPLANLGDRATREKLLAASLTRGSRGGEFDNREIITKIAKLRAERVQLLGYADFASFVMADQTAGKPEVVNKVMRDLAPAAVANAKREAADIQSIIDKENGGFTASASDWSMYSEKVRQAKFSFDETQLKPYFELNTVRDNGVFYAATRLFGITFKARPDLPTYHPDVKVFEIFDANKKSLAIMVTDFYARDSKRGGAWMNEYVSQTGLLKQTPVVGLHLNMPKPVGNKPSLMTWDEVTTFFHEFGHVLHGIFSDVKYPRFAGTNVPTDFVEFPSQVYEMWASDAEILKNYAKHHETGAVIPQALLDKVLAAQQFNQGYATTEYLAAALLDQAWHQLKPDQVPSADGVLAFEAKALKDVGLDYALVPPRYRTTYFSHIWGGGYSALYYGYLWAEVLDADSVEWFKENGGLKRENGDHFRNTLLSRGGSIDAMQMFRNFRGRDPDIKHLIKRRGLDQAAQ